MAETVILDSEALHALAHPRDRGVLSLRARAILTIAHEKGALVRVPAPVLSEVCRNFRTDAAVNHLLNSRAILVADLTRAIAQRAGHLLERFKLSSAHAIDAFVVATAAHFETAIVATADPADLRRFAAAFRNIKIFAL